MTVPLWIIAISVAAFVLGKLSIILFIWYTRLTRFNSRSKLKKSLNWLINGDYE